MSNSKNSERDFPGDPVVKTPLSQCREPEFDPWSGNKDPACCAAKIEEGGWGEDNVLNWIKWKYNTIKFKKNFNKELRHFTYWITGLLQKDGTQKQSEGDAQGKVPGRGGGVPDTPSS